MLTLNLVSRSTPYIEVPAPCATPDGGSFSVFLDFDDCGTECHKTYDHIHTSGPLDSFGNKECSHYSYEGKITAIGRSSKDEREVDNVNNLAWPPYPNYRVYSLPCLTHLRVTSANGQRITTRRPIIWVGSHGFIDLSYSTSQGARVTAYLSITQLSTRHFEMKYRCDGLASKPSDYWNNRPTPGKDPYWCWGGGSYAYEKIIEIEITDVKRDVVFYKRRVVREYERYWYFRFLELQKFEYDRGPYAWSNSSSAIFYFDGCDNDKVLETVDESIKLVDTLLDTTEASKVYADNSKDCLWSTIMVDALSSRKIIDCNLIMSLMELKNLSADLTKTLESYANVALGVRDLLKGKTKLQKSLLKEAAGAHLSTIYGYNLTLKECEQNGINIAACLDDLRSSLSFKQTLKARKQQYELWSCEGYLPTRATCNYSVTLRPEDNGFSALYDYLDRFSAWVTLSNAWDFIPYSFVVDWLLPVGKMLEAADIQAWQANHHVDTIVKSMKIESSVNVDRAFPGILTQDLLNVGAIKATKYHRWVESFFDSPPLYPDVGSVPDILRTHFPEGASLLVQRL